MMSNRRDKQESNKERNKKRSSSRKRKGDEKKPEQSPVITPMQSPMYTPGKAVPTIQPQTPVHTPGIAVPTIQPQTPINIPAKMPLPLPIRAQKAEPTNDYVQIVFDENEAPPPPPPIKASTPHRQSPVLENQPGTLVAAQRKSDASNRAAKNSGKDHQLKKPSKSSSNNDENAYSQISSSDTDKDREKVKRRKGSIHETGVVMRPKKKKHGNARSIKAKKKKSEAK